MRRPEFMDEVERLAPGLAGKFVDIYNFYLTCCKTRLVNTNIASISGSPGLGRDITCAFLGRSPDGVRAAGEAVEAAV